MNYKIDSLYNKVYSSFIRGEYSNIPKIPNKNEVLLKINEITSEDYIPITTKSSMSDINISTIRKNFSDIIDDVDVLFDSIEGESKEILDQLTNSLKEHNGVKREMRRIKTSSDDIANGKLGDEYLQYNFTESFDSSTNINVQKSDPINYDAGFFTIRKDTSNIVSLNHYRGSKIEFNIVENFSQINEFGYVGSTDASLMLDQDDPRALVYKINTSSPTRLRVAFSLQLGPNGEEISINSVVLDVDSDIAKGFIRLYYKEGFEWKDVNNSIQEIKSNKVVFNFLDIKTSYIKIEFIKDSPDSFDSNSYYYIINNIIISQSTTKRIATVYSRPIVIKDYSSEAPIMSKITVSSDVDIPKNCNIKVFVSQDLKISGAFLDSGNMVVNYDSPEVYQFDNTYSGQVYLSELVNAEDTITGVLNYKNLDFPWKEIQFSNNNYEQTPKSIEFDNTKKNDKLVNSLFTKTNFLKFGDLTYTGVYTLSGWVNTSNPNWATLAPLVVNGIYVSGVNVASLSGIAWEDIEDNEGNLNPIITSSPLYSGQWIGYSGQEGYPFGGSLNNIPLVYDNYTHSINGWWRPYSNQITPTGIEPAFSSGGYLLDQFNTFIPDFYFNNIHYYKIYKFGKYENLLESTVKLYTYQERPINNDNDIYPCNFKWKYKSKFINKVGIKESSYDPAYPSSWINYTLPISTGTLNINEEFILDSINEVRIHNTSTILDPKEYQVITSGVSIIGIDLSTLSVTREMLKTNGVTFDFKYLFRTKNEYLSTWTGFAIVSTEASTPYITIPNIKINDKNINLIQKIVVTNLDNGQVIEYGEDNGGIFNINLSSDDTEGHYKIVIYCVSNDENGFCANNWIPFEGEKGSTISVSAFVKLVSRIDPIKMVSLDALIYDSPLGDQRAAIYKENNEKYIVVKCPTKDNLPGYYFNSIDKIYSSDSTKQIDNKTHWIRQNSYNNGGIIENYYYTTGSSSNIVYKKDFSTKDLNWNAGTPMSEFINYTGYTNYAHHTTYGYPINIDSINNLKIMLYPGDVDPRAPTSSGNIVGSEDWLTWMSLNYPSNLRKYHQSQQIEITDSNRGYLFYNTAENLPSYYSVSYRTISNIDDTNNRFLYKISLYSDETGSLVPKIKSVRFIINGE